MVFQDAPAALHRIVLAVVWWIVSQAYLDTIVRHEIQQPLHELCTPTMVLWPIIQVNHQRPDGGEATTHPLPPMLQTIDQAVTRHFGGDAVQKQLVRRW